MPGIEPGFYAPEAYIMPLYDIPTRRLYKAHYTLKNQVCAL